MKTTTLLYVAKAEDNFVISQEIGERTAAHRGWQSTLLFYAALFWIRAYFEESGIIDKPSHYRRMLIIETTADLVMIAEDFARLQDISQDARYELPEIRESQLVAAKAHFGRIREHVEDLLRSDEQSEQVDESLSDAPAAY